MKYLIHVALSDTKLQQAMKRPETPVGGLLDQRFKYVPACKTNVALTIARVKAELANGSRKL